MNCEEAIRRLDQYLRTHHSVGVDDVEITETRGYWRLKKPCDESCRSPIHGCIGNSGRIQHTLSFTPHRREKGRFVSKYEVWDAIRSHT